MFSLVVSLLAAASNAKEQSKPPDTSDHVAYARWMAHTLTWGFLSTTSTRTEGTTPGTAFGNPYSFADVGGTPYIYASDLDGSMVDLFGASSLSTRGSLALSAASLNGGDAFSSCKIGGVDPLGDPENPPCSRLVLSGNFSKPAVGSPEEKAAKAALFAKHPSFKNYPPGHSFYVAKMQVEGVWLIDMYGGAATPSASDYLAYNSTVA